MANCLQDNEGAIGYIDAAHGHEALLTEIRLSNADGRFLTSKDAGNEGVQQAAVDLSDVPDSADGDFSEVAFYNMVCSYCCLVYSLGYMSIVRFDSHNPCFLIISIARSNHLAHLPSIVHLHP